MMMEKHYLGRLMCRSLLASLTVVIAGLAQSQSLPPGPTGVNDPYAARQWNLTAINAPQAWSLLANNPRTVRVAMIDSENSVHPDIRWTKDVMGQPLVPKSMKVDPHGTHVAGIIAAIPDNGQGISGICKQCEILPTIPVLMNDTGFADAIRLAVRLDAQVINISGELKNASGSGNCSAFPETSKAIAQAIEAGVAVVAAAGNHGIGFDPSASHYQLNVQNVAPASCAGVISVGATDQYSKMASYSNAGATLVAPGGGASEVDGAFGAGVECDTTSPISNTIATSTVGILSAWRTSTNSACYRHMSGTSMATPHVTGVVGLMLAANPALTPYQIKAILQNPVNATYIPSCMNGECGAGLLNAYKAVSVALGTPGAAIAYTGVCRFAFDEPCKIDTFDELPNGNISITAYGKMWNFDPYGALIGTPTALTSLPVYTRPNGPCSAANRLPQSGSQSGSGNGNGMCTLDVRTVVDYPGIGYLDSVGAKSKYWNYFASGEPASAEGALTSNSPKYTATLCKKAICQFETRLVVNFPEFGNVLESITYNGQYWNFDGTGKLLAGDAGNGWLKDVIRYQPICNMAGSSICTFDSREIKNNRNEVITAYGWYFEFSGSNLIKSYNLKAPRACFSPEVCNPFL